MTPPVVETSYGALSGERAGDLLCFKGIPFASPPVDKLRWMPPESPSPWSGTRSATTFGKAAPQFSSLGAGDEMLFADIGETSEDCLYLNVWTPGTGGPGRPVLVWIHGGAFVLGAGSQNWYDGSVLASRGDVVVVTINYRLGALGFLALQTFDDFGAEQHGASANLGILDQVAALEWVQDNISAFGGDPGSVTVLGESAGAMSVGTLLAAPRARGLFHRAVAESGAASTVSPTEVAAATAASFLEEVGLSPDRLDELADLSLERILDAQGALLLRSPLGTSGLPFAPSVDADVVPESPLAAVAAGRGAAVPLLIGTNLDEWKLFEALGFAGPSDEAGVTARLAAVSGSKERAASLFTAYREARPGGEDLAALWSAITTDYIFRIPAIRLAEHHREHVDQVWSYLFTLATPAFGGLLGSCHALEVPLVFGSHDKPPTNIFVGEGPEVAALATRMQDAWLAFARTGDPNGAELPPWPSYESSRRATMVLGPECAVEDDPHGAERQAWSGLLAP